jgi:hypothetical protein
MENSIIERGGLPINKMQYSDIQYSFVNMIILKMANI